MLRRARAWLLWKIAVWVWKERGTYKEFAEYGHQKYLEKANYYWNLEPEVQITERETELSKLIVELDGQARCIAEATETAEAELTEIIQERWA